MQVLDPGKATQATGAELTTAPAPAAQHAIDPALNISGADLSSAFENRPYVNDRGSVEDRHGRKPFTFDTGTTVSFTRVQAA